MVRWFLLLLFPVLVTTPVIANDSAVEIAVGGIQARKEDRVLMEKERLYISKDAVEVEYEFRNVTDTPVTTEIAFPIPPYEFDRVDNRRNVQFNDFMVWVDGKKIKRRMEARAFVGQREITSELRQANITIESFGWVWSQDAADGNRWKAESEFRNLPKSGQDKFVDIGAIKFDDGDNIPEPVWEVRLNYHWTQTFPPQTTIKIKHRYEPSFGYDGVQYSEILDRIKGSCLTSATMGNLQQRVDAQAESAIKGYLTATWISYILTTANTWRTPIRDFELVVEKEPGTELSFCWDGPVEQIGENLVGARKTDFVPKDELTVYFFKEW